MPILLRHKGLRVLVNPGDHNPLHVHVVDGGLEVKIDISGEEAQVLERGRNHQSMTTTKHTREAIALCQANLSYLKAEAAKYYV